MNLTELIILVIGKILILSYTAMKMSTRDFNLIL